MSAAGVQVRDFEAVRPASAAERVNIPWYVWCGVVGITSSSIGTWWDVAWHYSIGRDSFWTPAHMAIYLCGVLAGVVCGYLILNTTFGHSAEARAASVSVFGFRAPLGAFIAAWGGIAMLTAAPLDNWWHAAYGLDVQLITPPHTLIYIGMRSVTLGMLILILATMNRAAQSEAASFVALRRLMLYVGGLLVTDQMLLLSPFTYKTMLHMSRTYTLTAVMVLPVFVLLAQISRSRWAATVAASVYSAIILTLLYLLPLFPAHPRLGPVFTPVTHMIPPSFPILLLLPALALDLFWQRTQRWSVPLLAFGSALIFIAVLTMCEWPFGQFLISARSENWIFGTMYYPFFAHPADNVHLFNGAQHGAVLFKGLAEGVVLSFVFAWVALGLGRWMRTVQR